MFVPRIDRLLMRKAEIERRRIPKKELEEFTGLSRQSIAALTNPRGVKMLRADTVALLCEYFGIEYSEYGKLFDLAGDTRPVDTIDPDEDDEDDEKVAVA